MKKSTNNFLLIILNIILFFINRNKSNPSLEIFHCPKPLPNPNEDWSFYKISNISQFILDNVYIYQNINI